MDMNELIGLARAAGKAFASPTAKFSFNNEEYSSEGLNAVFAKQLNELGATPQLFRENKNKIFTLIETALTEVLPVKVMQSYGQFADVLHVAQGDKPVFKVRISEASRKRAKQFVTKVGLAGRYETFKLDGYSMEVPTSAYGGAARVEWEEMLDGRFTLNDYYSLVLEGMDEAVYREIAKALKATIGSVKPVNKARIAGFDEQEFDRLLQTADVYGKSAIYCTFEFASKMLPMQSASINWNAMSNEMKNEIWNNGAFTTYKGHRVIILPQSFEDEKNDKKVIDPSLCYIMPAGAEKPVKVAFEGQAQVKSFENRDWSTEIQTYQKLGVASYMINPGICVYENTQLVMTNSPKTSS